jgi:CBS domain-containing membrane protein
MLVRDVMTAEVRSAHRGDSLSELDAWMNEGRFRHVPVVDDDDELVGIVSHRDLVRAIVGSRRSRAERLEHLVAWQVMTAPVETAAPDETLAEAAQRMLEGKLGCLPVVEGRHLVGILTESDFVRLAAEG